MCVAFLCCTPEGMAAEGTRAMALGLPRRGGLQDSGSEAQGRRRRQEQSAVLPLQACCLRLLACVCVSGVWCGAPLGLSSHRAVLNPWDMCVSLRSAGP